MDLPRTFGTDPRFPKSLLPSRPHGPSFPSEPVQPPPSFHTLGMFRSSPLCPPYARGTARPTVVVRLPQPLVLFNSHSIDRCPPNVYDCHRCKWQERHRRRISRTRFRVTGSTGSPAQAHQLEGTLRHLLRSATVVRAFRQWSPRHTL
jgi:hypothetical protein